jgi:trimethylamine--corrinoid protein Co-methyltransferase
MAVLTQEEVEAVHRAALRIIAEVGLEVQSERILERLADFGGQVDKSRQRVTFAPAFVERFLAESERFDWSQARPSLSAYASIYTGLYHVPGTRRLEPWTEPRIREWTKLAAHLEHVDGVNMLTCPIGVPREVEPLYERLVAWKHGIADGGSLWTLDLCPYIHELCQAYAEATGQPLSEVFRGTVYLISPLRFGKEEASHFLYFYDRGLPVALGHQVSVGGSAPVTVAGAFALELAQTLLAHIVRRAYSGHRRLHLSTSLGPLDMRTLAHSYGAPEIVLGNLMAAQMARYYGATYSSNSGLSDAKLPSAEAGAQKVMTCLPSLLAGGSGTIAAGVLGLDMVFSPIQMILDNELVGALKRLLRGVTVDEEKLAVEVIKAVGPGGSFVGAEHTARHFREEQWHPQLWSRESLSSWLAAGERVDEDRALDRYQEIMALPDLEPKLSEEAERPLRQIIARAEKALVHRR